MSLRATLALHQWRGYDWRLFNVAPIFNSFVADMVDLNSIPESSFDAVICMDSSLPHLESDELRVRALGQMRMKLRPHGADG